MLKERRENDDLYSIYAYGNDDPDPANTDRELADKLSDNIKDAQEKLDNVR